jgi:hypothetical protein
MSSWSSKLRTYSAHQLLPTANWTAPVRERPHLGRGPGRTGTEAESHGAHDPRSEGRRQMREGPCMGLARAHYEFARPPGAADRST